jgi:hypothetical protein
MPYSEARQAIYIWIPKTAGTSLGHVLRRRGVFRRSGRPGLWGRIPPGDRERLGAANWQHIPAVAVRDLLGTAAWDRCYKFSVVRNTYDRLVSFYAYSRKARKDPGSVQYGGEDPGSFEEWLEAERPRGQLWYLADERGELLVDFVGRYETLRVDLLRVAVHMNLAPLRLERLNRSERKDYRSYYSEAARRRVEDLYGDEIERFRFSF